MPPLPEHERAGIRFKCTCTSMPEQYDVFSGDRQVGYVHSRRGRFTVMFPDVDGIAVHEGGNEGFGGFADFEREACLDLAASLILQELNRT